ncbi:hypothetical protein HZB89_00175, partial [archaeon]|nr:hypothetical protein [archaeon]
MKSKGALVTLSTLLLVLALATLYAVYFSQSAGKKEAVNEITALTNLQEKAENHAFNLERLLLGNRGLAIDFNKGIVFFKQSIPMNSVIPTQFDLNALTSDLNSYAYFIASKESTDFNKSFDVNFSLNKVVFTVKPFNALVTQAIYPDLSRKGLEVRPSQPADFTGYSVNFPSEAYSGIQGSINTTSSGYYIKFDFNNTSILYNNVNPAVASDFNIVLASGSKVNFVL